MITNKPLIVVFCPFNPFSPRHGAHHRALQQIHDLSADFNVLVLSSQQTSDVSWPTTPQLNSLAVDHNLFSIKLFDGSVYHHIYRLLHAILRRLYGAFGFSSCLTLSDKTYKLLLVFWFTSVCIAFRPKALVVHYSHWVYLSFLLPFIPRAVELHDSLPINFFLRDKLGELIQAPHLSTHSLPFQWPLILSSSHDLSSLVLAKLYSEISILNACSLVWMISERELSIYRSLGLTCKSFVIYPSFPSSHSTCKNTSPIIPLGPNIFNAFSIKLFFDEVIPKIDASVLSRAHIRLTGSLGAFANYVKVPNSLTHLGFCDNYSEILASSILMIVPTAAGTGQQMKVFEALASGTPVVTYNETVPTDVVELFPSIVCVSSPSEFADFLETYLTSPSLQSRFCSLAADSALRFQSWLPSRPYTQSIKSLFPR